MLSEDLIARLCRRQAELVVIFAASLAGLGLTLGSLLLVDLAATSRTVAYLNVLGLLFMVSWTGYVLYRCRGDIPFGRGEPGPES